MQKLDLLLGGRTPVCNDAVATAVMVSDPMVASGIRPFPVDNHLAPAVSLDMGIHDPKDIEVVGLALHEARHPYRWEPRERDGGHPIVQGPR